MRCTPNDLYMTLGRPSGGIIAVLGPDGSGKSTFSDAFVEGPLRGRPVLRMHHRPGTLASKTYHGVPVTEPHAARPYPRWLSLAKLFFLFLDFWVGWWTKVRPFVRRGGWVVWERPWWDLAIDPARYRLRGCAGPARWLGAALPAPALVIILEAPVDVLLSRKREVSAKELTRQSEELRHVIPRSVPTLILDSREPLEVLLQEAGSKLEALARRR